MDCETAISDALLPLEFYVQNSVNSSVVLRRHSLGDVAFPVLSLSGLHNSQSSVQKNPEGQV